MKLPGMVRRNLAFQGFGLGLGAVLAWVLLPWGGRGVLVFLFVLLTQLGIAERWWKQAHRKWVMVDEWKNRIERKRQLKAMELWHSRRLEAIERSDQKERLGVQSPPSDAGSEP